MPGMLADEIKQTRPFASLEVEALLNLLRSADALRAHEERRLRPHGLSLSSYNVLRILRGAGGSGLPSGEVAARMVTRDPDLTRLVDRLERSALVERGRQPGDRRVVLLHITRSGLRLLASLDAPMDEVARDLFSPLPADDVVRLISTLELLRSRAASSFTDAQETHP